MPEGWVESLAQNGAVFKDMIILRPALLTDGACKGDVAKEGKSAYQFSEHDIGNGYTVSRKDVAHFIVEVLLQDFAKFSGKAWSVAY